MEKSKIKNEINTLLAAIIEQYPTFLSTENLTEIKIETLLHSVEKLHENLILFKFISTILDIPISKKSDVTVVETKFTETTETKQIEPETNISTHQEKTEEANHKVEATEVLQEKKVETDKFLVNTLDSTAEGKENSFASKKNYDIKTHIGFNDRFLFTNELFNGNGAEFNIALTQINNSDNFSSALDYLRTLESLYNWEKESESYLRFSKIVEKTFS